MSGWLSPLDGLKNEPVIQRREKERRPVELDGKRYTSLVHAAKRLKVCRATVINRIERGRGKFL